VLKGVFVIVVELVVVVGIEEKHIFFGEDIAGADVGFRQSCLVGVPYFEYVAAFVL
jgi:hypothetical protein